MTPVKYTTTSVLALLLLAAATTPATAGTNWERKLRVGAEILHELDELPEGNLPQDLIEDANCIAVIPYLVKGAFWVGGKHGRGLLSCRRQDEYGDPRWSAPSAVRISGLSFGAQFGGQVTDLVLFFMSERGVKSLLRNRVTLGGDVSVAAGPVGRSAEAATDLRFKAEIYAYAKSRGLFAGVALEGAHLSVSDRGNRALYGEPVEAQELLFAGQAPSRPADLQPFLDALPQAASR